MSERNKARDITQNTIKQLYSLSENKCANPNCNKILILPDRIQTGEIAHICAANINGPRYDSTMTDDERRDVKNLLLLCPTCHNMIDSNPEQYPVELLKTWKRNHENKLTSTHYQNFISKLTKELKNSHIREQEIKFSESDFYEKKLLKQEDGKPEIVKTGIHVLSDFLLDELKNNELADFNSIFIKGVAGSGKSTEMRYAFNKIIEDFSVEDNLGMYQFSPLPYFFELKNYQDFFLCRR